ncbi:MAG: Uma2 family endonuclease [Rubrobacter sp.]|jgi:Uma2 family endonuclease|nr:Uma2 family endonuclease [Rubrobacter sp.]
MSETKTRGRENRELDLDLREVRYRFSADEFLKMGEAGIFDETSRVELIEGEIVEMNPIGTHHAGNVSRLLNLFAGKVRDVAIVAVQNPVHLAGHSEPQPDIALLKPREDFYSEHHPKPEDVYLLVEVADTSLAHDRDVKVPLYARYGIPEYWIVDLSNREVLAYSRPEDGKYRITERVKSGDELACRTLPNLSVKVEEILG